MNHLVIALIPKTQNASTTANFRLISYCNVFYKFIIKRLATRLSTVLPFIIDKAQSTFVKDRSMVENIHFAQKIIRGYSRKRTAPKCTLKIDIHKAYDTNSWEFLEKVLHALHFSAKFINWIMACVSTPTYFLKLNGKSLDSSKVNGD